jgi:hypothetical protein
MEYKTVLLNTQYSATLNTCIDELDALINNFARAGWEFVRIETRHVYKRLSRSAKFLGKEEIVEAIDIAVFRREGESAVSIPFVAAKVDEIAGKMNDISAKVDDIGKTANGIANAADGIISTTDALVANIVEEKTAHDREYDRRQHNIADDRQSMRNNADYGGDSGYRESRPGYPHQYCQNERDCPIASGRNERNYDSGERRSYPGTREYVGTERQSAPFSERERTYERQHINRDRNNREQERDEIRPYPKKLF